MTEPVSEADTDIVLTLPGWRGSGPGHWQTRWESLHGFRRVEQDDWTWPRRGDWLARLDEVIVDLPTPRPVRLVAHSLGCLLAAAWAAHSRHVARVHGALLVAPPDMTRTDIPPQLHGWHDVPLQPLPFAACVVASRDDPYAGLDHASMLARAWGAAVIDAGARGHLNAESGLGDWPEALGWIPR